MTTNNEQILCRSVSVAEKLENWKKAMTKRSNVFYLWGSLPIVFVYIVLPLLFELADERYDTPPGWLLLLLVVCFVACVWAASLMGKQAKEISASYEEHCRKEMLIADCSKVYGSTKTENFSLPYDMIAEVKTLGVKTVAEDASKFANSELRIRDKAGKYYNFKSFDNCAEMENIINSKLRELT